MEEEERWSRFPGWIITKRGRERDRELKALSLETFTPVRLGSLKILATERISLPRNQVHLGGLEKHERERCVCVLVG